MGCDFKIENFGLENATPPLKTQYGKEWSSKISGTEFFLVRNPENLLFLQNLKISDFHNFEKIDLII